MKLSIMNLYHLMDRSIGIKHQKNIWGTRLWNERRLIQVLVEEGMGKALKDRSGKVTGVEVNRKLTPEMITDLLYPRDPKKYKEVG